MYKFIFCILSLGFFVSTSFASPAELQIDTTKSAISWVGKKVVGKHNGILSLSEGSVAMEDNAIVSGSFKIDMSTISNKDMAGTKDGKKLEGHLKSDDFFNIEKFPLGSFMITKTTKLNDNEYQITGELEIKGIKNVISFPAKIEMKDGVYHASAKTKLNRVLWDITYNSGKFFDVKALGDKLIYDDIEIALDLHTLPAKQM